MRSIHFDSVGGASGDMILACLIGLGADADLLRAQLSSLDAGPFKLAVEHATAQGMACLRVRVTVPGTESHPHRRLRDILGLIRESELASQVKTMSAAVFERLAEAESAVHGVSVEDIPFHEVGALDSIVDIVGSCAALHMLAVDRVTAGPLPLGQGSTETAHGLLPVPVPATVELLKGLPVEQTNEPFELVTPTAAALLSTWIASGNTDAGPPDCNGTILASATATGHRTLRCRPNILRVRLSEHTAAVHGGQDTCLVLECNLDDTVPELLGSLVGKLIERGALDASITPIQMKKQRPGSLLTVLCRPEDREELVDLVFAESTTFGIREHPTWRTMLDRRHVTVDTPYGEVRVKIGTWKGRDITRAPEHDDCVRCAEEYKVPVRAVYEAACAAAAAVPA